jgi:hypothetical protein
MVTIVSLQITNKTSIEKKDTLNKEKDILS